MNLVLLSALPLLGARAAAPPTAVDEPRLTEAPVAHPLRAALASTSAFGVTHDRFFNQLLGARLEYRFTPRFAFGAAISYANLKGRDGRVHNVLPEATLEYRLALGGERWGVPLRYGLGFLPKNGPTLRLGAGLDFMLSATTSLELVPLEPLVWITRERPEISLDATLAVRAAF